MRVGWGTRHPHQCGGDQALKVDNGGTVDRLPKRLALACNTSSYIGLLSPSQSADAGLTKAVQCFATPTSPRSTVTDAAGKLYKLLSEPTRFEVTAGPSGSAWPFLRAGCHWYCSFPNVTMATGPAKYVSV